jgi:hypothetical protein
VTQTEQSSLAQAAGESSPDSHALAKRSAPLLAAFAKQRLAATPRRREVASLDSRGEGTVDMSDLRVLASIRADHSRHVAHSSQPEYAAREPDKGDRAIAMQHKQTRPSTTTSNDDCCCCSDGGPRCGGAVAVSINMQCVEEKHAI